MNKPAISLREMTDFLNNNIQEVRKDLSLYE